MKRQLAIELSGETILRLLRGEAVMGDRLDALEGKDLQPVLDGARYVRTCYEARPDRVSIVVESDDVSWPTLPPGMEPPGIKFR